MYTPVSMIANGLLTIGHTNVTNSGKRIQVQTQVNGVTIAFNDRGAGRPIVFLHAFPLNRTMWETQEHALSSQFRVITIDLRGHGESDAPLWRYTEVPAIAERTLPVVAMSSGDCACLVSDYTVIC